MHLFQFLVTPVTSSLLRHSLDFSALYTNIPHDLLLDSISQLISEAYRISGAGCMWVPKHPLNVLVHP